MQVLIAKICLLMTVVFHTAYNHPINACVYAAQDSSWHCINQNLKAIPISEIKDKPARTLNFAYSDIELSSSDMRDLLSLDYRHIVTEIIFNNNNISKIPDNLYQVFPNLEKIYFNGNNIHTVRNEFNQLDNLKILYLDNNPIKTISRDAIRRLANLEKLSLKDTNFTSASINRPSVTNKDLKIIDNGMTTSVTPLFTTLLNNTEIHNNNTESNMSNLSSYSAPKSVIVLIMFILRFM